jgi:hypothetical protein
MTMAGNGEFKWYWADSEDAERWHGAEDSREAAIQAARGELGNDESFWICEADKSVMTANFNAEHIAERIMDDLIEGNEECWTDDFEMDKVWPDEKPEAELANGLRDLVESWLERFPGKTWCFGDTRYVEKIKALIDA